MFKNKKAWMIIGILISIVCLIGTIIGSVFLGIYVPVFLKDVHNLDFYYVLSGSLLVGICGFSFLVLMLNLSSSIVNNVKLFFRNNRLISNNKDKTHAQR